MFYPAPANSPATPKITFLVTLALPAGTLSPNAYQEDKTLGHQYDANQQATRVTYFPGLLTAENRELHDGDTFQLAGYKADYYRQEIAKGNFPFLSIYSIDA